MVTKKFQGSFLYPQYWPIWLALFLFALSVNLLPHPILMAAGRALGRLSKRFLKKRLLITERNLKLAYPDKTQAERNKICEQTFENLGCAVFETGMAWFWPQWRLRKKIMITGDDIIHNARAQGQGVLVLVCHSLHLELSAALFSFIDEGIGVYRPHKNALWEWLLYKSRCRNNNELIDRFDIKAMIRTLKKGKILWFLPDHDYGQHASVFVPFFGVDHAATITTPATLAKVKNTICVYYHVERSPQGIYHMDIQQLPDHFPSGDLQTDAHQINTVLEKKINRYPEQYLWLHKRFKTDPCGKDNYKDLAMLDF